jgi:hypothetical protein
MNAVHAVDRYSPIYLGTDFAGRDVSFSFQDAVNFSMLVAGMSGSGKTHGIRRLVREYCLRGITVMMLDTQGDLCRGEKRVPDEIRHDITFKYGSGGATLNPLRIDVSNNMGGYHVTVEDVVEIFRIVKRGQLGDRQTGDLRQLVIDCYAKRGIQQRDPSTWSEPAPTWTEFHTFVKEIMGGGHSRIDPSLYLRLEEVAAGLALDQDWIEKKLTAEQLVRDPDRLGETSLNWLQEGLADELDRIASKEAPGEHRYDWKRLDSIEQTIRGMANSGLFGDESVRPKLGKVNVFDLSSLRLEHKQAMIRILLDRIFYAAVRMTGDDLNPPVPHTMIVLDEAKYAVAGAKGALSPLNRISTEGRKFGLGALCGVQHLKQLNTDLRSNISTKLLLHMEETYWPEAMKIMRVTEAEMRQIKPRSDGLFKFNDQATRAVHLQR